MVGIDGPCLQEIWAPQSGCFGCGPQNAQGLRIRSFAEADGGLIARFRPAPHHRAFGAVLNGGICGALLDCHSNWAAAHHLLLAQGASALPPTVTADFHVTLRRPTPLDVVVIVRARVVETAGERCVVESSLEAGGKTTATCRGTFVAVAEGHPAFHRWD